MTNWLPWWGWALVWLGAIVVFLAIWSRKERLSDDEPGGCYGDWP